VSEHRSRKLLPREFFFAERCEKVLPNTTFEPAPRLNNQEEGTMMGGFSQLKAIWRWRRKIARRGILAALLMTTLLAGGCAYNTAYGRRAIRPYYTGYYTDNWPSYPYYGGGYYYPYSYPYYGGYYPYSYPYYGFASGFLIRHGGHSGGHHGKHFGHGHSGGHHGKHFGRGHGGGHHGKHFGRGHGGGHRGGGGHHGGGGRHGGHH
jgi:hypothetical protein